jgi:inversin
MYSLLALHAAALSGHSSTVKLLLKCGARLEVTDQARHTPLIRACEMGHMDVVQTLIDHGARVDVLDQNGRSPLHWSEPIFAV